MDQISSPNPQSSPIVVALDFPSSQAALEFVDTIQANQCRVKVGKELFTAAGPGFIEALQKRGFEVFLDLKFHDIPTTVAKAVKAAAELGVWMVNVHASGGPKMLDAASNAIDRFTGAQKPLLIAVTVLTTIDATQWRQIGHTTSITDSVKHLATMSKAAGLDGVVCSAIEATDVKRWCGESFQTVTPGIRLDAKHDAQHQVIAQDDQSRVMTPERAVSQGSNFLVMGRPITQSTNPSETLNAINERLFKL